MNTLRSVAVLLAIAVSAPALAQSTSRFFGARSFESGTPITPYYNFLYYTSIGDTEHALAEFADDAVVVAGLLCPVERPCRGKPAIKERYIKPMTHGKIALPLPDQYNGQMMRTHSGSAEHRVPDRHIFELQDGRIASVRPESAIDIAPTPTAHLAAAVYPDHVKMPAKPKPGLSGASKSGPAPADVPPS